MIEGKQVKVKLSNVMLAALEQEAKARGEAKIQSVVRSILADHFRQQAREANVNVPIPTE